MSNYTHDNAGRLTGKTYSNTAYSATFTWDSTGAGNAGIGYLGNIADESAVSYRDFDTKGNITTDFQGVAPMTSTVVISYAYDLAGTVTGLTYPSGHYIKYQRDSLGRITSVTGYASATSTASFPIATSVNWNPYGPIQSVSYGNGLVETFSSDTDYRTKEVKITSATATVDDRALTWMGDTLTGINDSVLSSFSESFVYTATNRLASATGSYCTFAWTYDAVGVAPKRWRNSSRV